MALECALEWLRGPLMGIQGVVDIVASFFFKFQGVKVRVLPRESRSAIECLVALPHAWAIGDSAGYVSVYDLQCKQLLRTYNIRYPVFTIATFGENGFMCNANSGFWVLNNLEPPNSKFRRITGADDRGICKLLSFPADIAASCSNTENVHVYDITRQSTYSLKGPGRVTDIVKCDENTLWSVHNTHSNVAVWLWDVQRGTHLRSIPFEFVLIYNVVATPHTLVFIDPEYCVHAYNLETMHDSIVGTTDRFCTIPDDRIISSGFDRFGTIDVLNARLLDKPQARSKGVYSNFKFVYVHTGHVIMCNFDEVQVWK